MSEIRNLTRNGETFYPLTCTDAIVDRDGNSLEIVNDIFDISEYNASGTPLTRATYASLDLALAAVPQSKQKGGMTIRYIQSPDDIYVQYRLLTESFNVSVKNWAKYDDGVYYDDPEYIKTLLDKNKRVIIAVKKDGDIFFGAGCPSQVQNYIQSKIDELNLNDVPDIVDFLNNLESGDKNLRQLLNEKVDKEEGKSLIPSQYIQEKTSIEFIDAKTDKLGKLISGTTIDGITYIYDLFVQKTEWLSEFFNSLIKKRNNFAQRNFAFLDESPITVLQNETISGGFVYNELINCLSVLKISDSLYYMYYESSDLEADLTSDAHMYLCFAYSTDGINWIKEIPSGITPPSVEEKVLPNQILPRGKTHGHNVVKVPDYEYPYRLICLNMDGNPQYAPCIYKSRDGVNWEFIRLITNNGNDAPISCIVRGNTLKIYCRTRTDTSEHLRSIGVIFTDLDGNRYYGPINTNKEQISIVAPDRQHQYYQASASPLDDHREILFPTIYNERPAGSDPSVESTETVGCLIVDGNHYEQIDFQDAIVNTNDVKSIYFASGLINIGADVYAYYVTRDHDHEHAPVDTISAFHRVKINII